MFLYNLHFNNKNTKKICEEKKVLYIRIKKIRL